MIPLLFLIDLVLYLAMGALLIRAYRHRRDPGMLWILLPLVVIPGVALGLTLGRRGILNRLEAGLPVDSFPFIWVADGRLPLGDVLTLLNLAEHVVWGGFALLAVWVLTRPTRG